MIERPRLSRRWLPWLLVSVSLLVFAGANAHLVYVAFHSQSGCVAHVKETGSSGSYRAAKPAC